MSAGVPQGSILGPLLFSLYVNDLPNVCLISDIQMYADDTVVFVHANSADQAAVQLTNSTLKITEWLKHNCLQLNLSKTVCMFFNKSKSCCAEPDVVIDGERLQVVSDFKYLGVYIDSNLTFRSHYQEGLQ